ncbi:ribonuclease H-like domain-containing protein, partial [Cadophora sp. MPI-SDFR-AT-0126]
IDTRWNSAYDMIDQFLELEAEYTEFVDTHPQVKCLLPSSEEIVALYQLRKVLKPFKDHTLKVSEVMPSISQSLDIYWDLEALLDDVVEGVGDFTALDMSIRNAFSKGKAKHVTYMKKLDDQMMLFAAHILDPRYKTHQLEMMIPDQYSEIIAKVKKYFKTEWPELATLNVTSSTPSQSRPAERPQGVSIAQWKAIQMKKAKEADAGAAIPTSELERWFATPRTEFDESIAKSPDFLRKWWKEHKDDWPLLAAAARHLLSVSGSEVDVERLFS